MQFSPVSFIKRHYLAKVLLIYICILIITVAALSLAIYSGMRSDTISHEMDNTDIMLRNITNYFSAKQALVSKILIHAYLDSSNLTEALEYLDTREEAGNYRFVELTTKFHNYFLSLFGQDRDIVSVVVYKKLEGSVFLYTRGISSKEDADRYAYPERLEQTSRIDAQTTLYPAYHPFYTSKSDEYVYTFTTNIKRLGTNRITGLLSIDYNASGIEQYLTEIGAKPKGLLVVINPEGGLIYHSQRQYLRDAYSYKSLVPAASRKEIEFAGQKNIINTYTDRNTGITAINIIPTTEALSNVRNLTSLMFRITLICILASALLTALSVWLFSKRIDGIISYIKKVRLGKLDVQIPVTGSKDELAEISTAFNEMCGNLNHYIQQVYVAEINRKNAELKQKSAQLDNLQSQINPHFLYNAMEVIRMKALNEQCPEVADMLVSLARLFRNSIKSDNIISVKEEIQYSTSYLRIFEACYQDNLKVIYDIDDDILHYSILKHLIHPIFENYILHGFMMENGQNVIMIKGFRQGDFMVFQVTDNGKGIPSGKLTDIRQNLHHMEQTTGGSIGLANVNQRIRLVYGSECGLEIDSTENLGTKVTIRIRIKTKKELTEYVQSTDCG